MRDREREETGSDTGGKKRQSGILTGQARERDRQGERERERVC